MYGQAGDGVGVSFETVHLATHFDIPTMDHIFNARRKDLVGVIQCHGQYRIVGRQGTGRLFVTGIPQLTRSIVADRRHQRTSRDGGHGIDNTVVMLPFPDPLSSGNIPQLDRLVSTASHNGIVGIPRTIQHGIFVSTLQDIEIVVTLSSIIVVLTVMMIPQQTCGVERCTAQGVAIGTVCDGVD